MSYTLVCDSCQWRSIVDSLDNAEFASDFHTDENHGHMVACFEGDFYFPGDRPLWTVTRRCPKRRPGMLQVMPEDMMEDFQLDESTE